MDQTEQFHLCKIISIGKPKPTKYGQRCEVLAELVKTNCKAFESASRIKIVTWKQTAEKAATFRKGQRIIVFFKTFDLNSTDWQGNTVKSVTSSKIQRVTQREFDMYSINSNGQYDPFSKLIV